MITKPGFIRELWPAQVLLGEQGVYRGRSAVIQMPTSAGKTRSIELIIRANLLVSDRPLTVVVAPFKALCSEIKQTLQAAFRGETVRIDAPSDAFQTDLDVTSDLAEDNGGRLVLVLTPEKFLYMLRQAPELAALIGLLVYDEGHQFDNGIRGVAYELLLSSLRLVISSETQIVLISAVIQNAEEIGDWLIGPGKAIVNGRDLLPTYRTVGFTSWNTAQGRIEYVQPDHPDNDGFFVPRVLRSVTLAKLGRERNDRIFPVSTNGRSVAVYLGLKLTRNGALAIFCGSKPVVQTTSELVNDLRLRNYTQQWPSTWSDAVELPRLLFLHAAHFGASHTLTRNSEIGVFAHSGAAPQGIRLCIEYAMQQGHIRFLICTSTLAQGVNLPLKYLLVTGFYQATEKIKTRDFHNLIGRAGIHTEGSILFTDPEIYDNKAYRGDAYNWGLAKGWPVVRNLVPVQF